ncbi:MAG: hypothetical protein FD123_4192 [Bacteroidetes bacterium]|nr:MAG: hypothetical protein FD123_4192 [Bacteroidota bacterium]
MRLSRLVFLSAFFILPRITELRAQITIIFQPDSVCGKDALIWTLWPDNNSAQHPDFIACAWTNQGNPSGTRALIDFDLAVIPAGAAVQQATLELSHYPSPYNTGHSNLSGPADCWLERIIQAWQDNTVTWNNQPATTVQNQLNIPAPTVMTQNYTLNVTQLVQDMLNDPANSFGFMLRLQNESYYRSLLFASSDNPYPQLRPKLTVVYTPDTLPAAGCWVLVQEPGDTTSAQNPPPDPEISIPNVFSPNGDGINDLFFPDTAHIEGLQFRIFDRWGVEVFSAFPAMPWDGRNTSGIPCSDGTYYYIFDYRTAGQNQITRKGFLTLIR